MEETLSRRLPGSCSSERCSKKIAGLEFLQGTQILTGIQLVSHQTSIWRCNIFMNWSYGSENTYAYWLTSEIQMEVVSSNLSKPLVPGILCR